jgi:hypothetical protein
LQQALASLVEAEVLYQRGLPPQAHYVFKHALIQDVVVSLNCCDGQMGNDGHNR